MEEKRNQRKLYGQVLFLVFLVAATGYALFRGKELDQIWAAVQSADTAWILAGILLVIVFVCSESVIICYMMRSLGRKVPLRNCIRYSFIGFFYSCITPSATGGQPAQIYYMNKDKIEIPVSTLVLMIVTITYKFVLVLAGLFVLLFYRPLIDRYMADTSFWFLLGIILNVGCVTLMSILIFCPRLTKWLMHKGLKLLVRLRLLRQKEEREHKLMAAMDSYGDAARYFRSHRLVVCNVVLISIFQRVCLFAATYLVYRAFHLNGTSAFDIILLQSAISVAVDMLPLPGGMGASEALFLSIFEPVFGGAMVLPAMLLSRGISYYALLIISALVTVYAHMKVTRALLRGTGVHRV